MGFDPLPAERRGKAAAAAARSAARRTAPAAPPKGEVERKIAGLWSRLLGQAEVGVDDNFFDAGGQSILLLHLHRRIEQEFDRKLSIVTLLQYPTIRTLAAHLGSTPVGTSLAQAIVGTSNAHRPAEAAAERARKQREALARQRDKANPG